MSIDTLSSTQADARTSEKGQQYLTFILGEERFALDIRSVREIVQYSGVAAIPLVPKFIHGVVNLRGAVVPVIDLRVRFGRLVAKAGNKTCIIIFNAENEGAAVVLGLLVDAVSQVVNIASSQMEPTPQFGASIPKEFILGMGKLDAEFIVLVEPSTALNIEEMAAMQEEQVSV